MQNKLSVYMVAYPDRFIFNEQERKECFKTIESMVNLARRVNNVSRASLEEDAYQSDIFFLRKALFLYIDNVGTDVINDILESYIVFGAYKGKELLERLIILDGISSIYKTMSPDIIEERLLAYIGEELAGDYERDKNSTRAMRRSTEERVPEAIEEFVPRKVIVAQTANPNRVLSQSEIDNLLATLL